MSQDWLFSEFLSFKKHGERESTRVLVIDFFDFNRLIREEEIEMVVFFSAIIRFVSPQYIETKYLSVIF